jgi:hypothetical protein
LWLNLILNFQGRLGIKRVKGISILKIKLGEKAIQKHRDLIQLVEQIIAKNQRAIQKKRVLPLKWHEWVTYKNNEAERTLTGIRENLARRAAEK